MRGGQVSEGEQIVIRSTLTGLCADPAGEFIADDVIHDLLVLQAVVREAERAQVHAVARLQRMGTFAEFGQRPETALADLWGVERSEARLVVTAAERALPRVDLQGQPLPALLPATALAFDAGDLGLRHVGVISRLMGGQVAARLTPDLQDDAERALAGLGREFTPHDVRDLGTQLLDRLDQDGPAPDDRDPEPVNELFLSPDRLRGGGRINGRFDQDLYDVIAAVLDAKAKPRTADDRRPVEQRQAEAMGEVFGWVATHGDADVVPETGGHRPHVNVHIRLEDLENRARGALLDFGGTATPGQLRRLCCDARVVPIVLGGAGQPLDVGRAQRTVPDGLRRAVTARDRGCAHPGCDRLPSWCEIHHVIPWERGGETTLSGLVMLCCLHHREIHYGGWDVEIGSDGIPVFGPPSWVDPSRTPRRKPRW